MTRSATRDGNERYFYDRWNISTNLGQLIHARYTQYNAWSCHYRWAYLAPNDLFELNFMNFYHVRSPLKLSAAGYKDPIKLLEPYMCIQHSVFTHGEINRIILDWNTTVSHSSVQKIMKLRQKLKRCWIYWFGQRIAKIADFYLRFIRVNILMIIPRNTHLKQKIRNNSIKMLNNVIMSDRAKNDRSRMGVIEWTIS